MRDRLLICDAPEAGLRLSVCVATATCREAAARHRLAEGSAGALSLGLCGALLLAAHEHTRVDIHLECNGPVRGLLADADESGAVRGLVRANGVAGPRATGDAARFDPRPLLASPHDERAGMLSVSRAQGAGAAHRAAFPFAGADLGAALTLFLREDRAAGGEMALEVVASGREPLAAAAGALIAPLREEDGERARLLGKPLRQRVLPETLLRTAEAQAIADGLARAFDLGPLSVAGDVEPRFACRCSRERVAHALRSLGGPELRDMAERDGGASLTCDFCNAAWRFTADELLALAQV